MAETNHQEQSTDTAAAGDVPPPTVEAHVRRMLEHVRSRRRRRQQYSGHERSQRTRTQQERIERERLTHTQEQERIERERRHALINQQQEHYEHVQHQHTNTSLLQSSTTPRQLYVNNDFSQNMELPTLNPTQSPSEHHSVSPLNIYFAMDNCAGQYRHGGGKNT